MEILIGNGRIVIRGIATITLAELPDADMRRLGWEVQAEEERRRATADDINVDAAYEAHMYRQAYEAGQE